jgi:hypothetical protein
MAFGSPQNPKNVLAVTAKFLAEIPCNRTLRLRATATGRRDERSIAE